MQFSTEDAWRRFLRAVRLSPTFRCEQIVPLVTAGRKEGFCFTVSRYIPGPSAAQLIHKIGIAGMLDWKITLGIAIDLALALVTLEQAQVVHRNITPHNILVESQSMRAYLNDAVLAKAWDTVSVDRLTTDGEIIGDLAFASPEVVGSGFPVDSRADQYSLGATLYALLTGRPPFPCRTVGEMIPAILSQLPVSPREFNLSIPAPFEALILRLLAKRPDARYPNSETLLKDLRKLSWICPSHPFK